LASYCIVTPLKVLRRVGTFAVKEVSHWLAQGLRNQFDFAVAGVAVGIFVAGYENIGHALLLRIDLFGGLGEFVQRSAAALADLLDAVTYLFLVGAALDAWVFAALHGSPSFKWCF
jgi:hypothetical protein